MSSNAASGIESASSGAQLEVVGSCKLTYLGMPVDPETIGSRDLQEVEIEPQPIPINSNPTRGNGRYTQHLRALN